MSLKAGRVGVNPKDVNPVDGSIQPSAMDAYTKVQADDKFLSKSDASSTYLSQSDASGTYETKSAAADLQPKTLSEPVVLLNGNKVTVEEALNGLNFEKLRTKKYVDTTGLDLNDEVFMHTGFYHFNGSVAHAPESLQFFSALVIGDETSTRQLVYRPEAIYVRSYGGSPAQWNSWYKYTGTIVS